MLKPCTLCNSRNGNRAVAGNNSYINVLLRKIFKRCRGFFSYTVGDSYKRHRSYIFGQCAALDFGRHIVAVCKQYNSVSALRQRLYLFSKSVRHSVAQDKFSRTENICSFILKSRKTPLFRTRKMHHSFCRPFSFGQETVFFVSVHYGKRSGVIIAERIYHLAKSFFVIVAVKRDNIRYLHSALGYRTCFIKAENVNSCKGFHAV